MTGHEYHKAIYSLRNQNRLTGSQKKQQNNKQGYIILKFIQWPSPVWMKNKKKEQDILLALRQKQHFFLNLFTAEICVTKGEISVQSFHLGAVVK